MKKNILVYILFICSLFFYGNVSANNYNYNDINVVMNKYYTKLEKENSNKEKIVNKLKDIDLKLEILLKKNNEKKIYLYMRLRSCNKII